MSNLETTYIKMLEVLHQIEPKNYFLSQIRKPKLTDKQLLALSLAAESLGIDSERYLFKRLPTSLKELIERSVYNRRRRALTPYLVRLRERIAEQIIPFEDYHIVDSMPLEIAKFSRAKRSTVCCEHIQLAPNFGYCAAQKTHYYGYKFHGVCTVQGVFKHFNISKASNHDIHYLDQVKDRFAGCVLIGDKGYLSSSIQQDLFDTYNLKVETPMRRNQADYKPLNTLFSKHRKRIETLFSQLGDQFMIKRNYAKSFSGYSTRILAKVSALTLIQWVNKLKGRNLNSLKGVLS
jgi:hypothetical protein